MTPRETLDFYYPNWRHQMPPGGVAIASQGEATLAPGTPAGTTLLANACQFTIPNGQVAVILRYGVKALENVPATDYVGSTFQAMPTGALSGMIQWRPTQNGAPAIQTFSQRGDGRRLNGFMENIDFSVYRGAEPVLVVGPTTFAIALDFVDATTGQTISPDGINLIATVAGYRMPIRPNPSAAMREKQHG